MAIRRNLCPIPACKYGVGEGWFGGGRVTGLAGFPRTTGYQISSGSDGGTARGSVVAGRAYTVSASARMGVNVTLQCSIHWYRRGSYLAAGGSVGYAMQAGVVRRVGAAGTAPSGADQALLVVASRSGSVVLTAVLIEQSATYGSFFDGDSQGAAWDGSNGSSTSTLDDTAAAQTVTLSGVGSEAAVGRPALAAGPVTVELGGLESSAAVGVPAVERAKLRPPGVPSQAAVGRIVLRPGPVSVGPVGGVASRVGFGLARLRTSIRVVGQLGAVRRAVGYSLEMVARVPSASGPPTFLTVDEVPVSGLAWSEELSKPPRLDASSAMASLPDSVLRRVADMRRMPSELHLYRGSSLVHAGPLINWQRQGETLTLYSLGHLAYARYWWLESDLVFAQRDQHEIARGLLDHWQGLEFGHFGLDTSQIAPSGVLRDATYLAKEGHNVGQRVEELGRRQNGFDVEVDPLTRAVKLHHPVKGVDRSVGESAIVLDRSNITSGDVAGSVGPDDVASEGYGTGDEGARSHRSNLDLRASFGRTGVAASFDKVSEQATLDDHTQALIDARSDALIVPGPNVRVTPDIDPTSFSVGDTVAYVLPDRLGVVGAFRVRKRTVTVDPESGRESLAFEFA